MLAGRELDKLLEQDPGFEVIKTDVAANPRKAWKDNIRMIPALKCGDRVLSGIFLSREQIRNFIEEAKRQGGER